MGETLACAALASSYLSDAVFDRSEMHAMRNVVVHDLETATASHLAL